MKRLVERLPIVHQKRRELHDSRENPPAAGGSEREPYAVTLADDRAVVGQATLAGAERVGFPRLRIEPHDAVVHEDAALRQREARAEYRKQGLRYSRHVAVPIDDAEVRSATRRAAAVDITHARESEGVRF